VTGPADRPQQPGPGGTTGSERNDLYSFFRHAQTPGTWTSDAPYPADSPIPYTLTVKAETLLGEAGSPTSASPKMHAHGMTAHAPQAETGRLGRPRAYVTEICLPPSDRGIQRLHARMPDPGPEPEAGL
jgi:hypothetical protein